MFKLLIVDDDEIMRAGLINNIRWESRDITVVGSARDGEEGFRMAGELKPDVILTDIRMPREDGLSMTRRIREEYPEIKVVVLSAFEDFTYVRESMKLSVLEYVLKYSSNEEILESVYRACKELGRIRDAKSKSQVGEARLREEFLVQLLLGGISKEEFLWRDRKFDLGLEDKKYQVAVVHVESSNSFAAKTPLNDHLLNYAVRNICDEILQGHPGVYSAQAGNNLVLIDAGDNTRPAGLEGGNREERFVGMMQRIFTSVKEYLMVPILISVGNRYQSWQDISKSYGEALTMLGMVDLSGKDQVVYFKDLKGAENSQQSIYNKLIEYIDTNCYHEELSLEQIAASAYVSSGYACTVYKKYSGKSINTYIKDKRMEKAMELLRNTRLLVTNIAQIVGYDNPRYFSMLFKKHTGRTPMEYQADEQR